MGKIKKKAMAIIIACGAICVLGAYVVFGLWKPVFGLTSVEEWVPPAISDIKLGMSSSQVKQLHPEMAEETWFYKHSGYLRLPNSEYEGCGLYFDNRWFLFKHLRGIRYGRQADPQTICKIVKEWQKKLGPYDGTYVESVAEGKGLGMGWERDDVKILLMLYFANPEGNQEEAKTWCIRVYIFNVGADTKEIFSRSIEATEDDHEIRDALEAP